MTTSAVQAPRVRRAATAASITHTRVESVVDVVVLDSVFDSGCESRGVRARRSEGIVAVSAQLARVIAGQLLCVCLYMCAFVWYAHDLLVRCDD